MKTRPIVFEANGSGCLEVTSHRPNRGGYPMVTVHGITQGAHRHVYEECFGPIPDGQYVLHRCDNRRCANPEHLFPGTKTENARDRDLKFRQARGERNAHAKLTIAAIKEIRRRYRPPGCERRLSRLGSPVRCESHDGSLCRSAEGVGMARLTKAWKENERRVAGFFGARRNPLSGSGSGVTSSDTRHPLLFIEQKRRQRHAVVQLWDQVAELAKREGKIPVVTLTEHGRPGFWLVVHSEDLAAVASAAVSCDLPLEEKR